MRGSTMRESVTDVRINIVNLSHIKQFTRTMVTTGISSVPISRNNYSAFKDAYFSYMFDSNSG